MRRNPVSKKTVTTGGYTDEDKEPIEYDDKSTNYEPMILSILNHVGNLRLIGDTGTGKSTIVHWLCQRYDWELHEYSLSADTIRQDLLASEVLKAETVEDKSGKETIVTVTKVRLGRIAQWLIAPRHPEKRQVLFLDEYNYANPGIMGIINSLADFRGSVYVPEMADTEFFDTTGKGEEPVLKRKKDADGVPKHLMIIGMNPSERQSYTGTNQMNIAQLRRFESVNIDYISPGREKRLIDDRVKSKDGRTLPAEIIEWLVSVAKFTRDEYRANHLSIPITTGNLINYGKIILNDLPKDPYATEKILDVIKAMYPEGEKDIIETQRTKIPPKKA